LEIIKEENPGWLRNSPYTEKKGGDRFRGEPKKVHHAQWGRSGGGRRNGIESGPPREGEVGKSCQDQWKTAVEKHQNEVKGVFLKNLAIGA